MVQANNAHYRQQTSGGQSIVSVPFVDTHMYIFFTLLALCTMKGSVLLPMVQSTGGFLSPMMITCFVSHIFLLSSALRSPFWSSNWHSSGSIFFIKKNLILHLVLIFQNLPGPLCIQPGQRMVGDECRSVLLLEYSWHVQNSTQKRLRTPLAFLNWASCGWILLSRGDLPRFSEPTRWSRLKKLVSTLWGDEWRRGWRLRVVNRDLTLTGTHQPVNPHPTPRPAAPRWRS